MKKKIAIIGLGWVGNSMATLFPENYVYDPKLGFDDKDRVNQCDIAFICVPTPNKPIFEPVKGSDLLGDLKVSPREGALDTSIVEEVISWCECPLIVVRSTVNPGDCDRWANQYKKEIVFQPEYLGETPAHPLFDPTSRPFIIIGSNNRGLGYLKPAGRQLIDLYTNVYNSNVNIRQVTNFEAEVIKLSENRAIAWKVAQCQELYDVCEKAGVDYYTIREAVYGDDPRFDLWFSFIYPDNRGMNSKCIPKDVYAWCAFAESVGYEPKITRALLEKNKEWVKND